MSGRRRILFVQPSFQPPGGGQAVGAWMMQALQPDYDLATLSWSPFEVGPINSFYGTCLDAKEIHSTSVSAWLRRSVDSVPLPLAHLKRAVLTPVARRLSLDADLCVSASNEASFGRPGIQYIHYPAKKFPRPDVDLRWYHLTPALRAYYALADVIAGDPTRGRENLTLSNSDWTGALMTDLYGVHSMTLYPPVTTSFAEVPWDQRENAFLCIGRLSPEKELERIIDILAAVRRRGHDVTLQLVGSRGPAAYQRRIRRRVEREGPWVRLEEDMPRDQLLRRIPVCRFGIHGMREEHFGIAPAEMVAAGCIVFVPRGGGQVEIVAGDERLTYRSVDEAATLVSNVLSNRGLQDELRAVLERQRLRFSTERFVERFRAIVEERLADNRLLQPPAPTSARNDGTSAIS
jgi:glycosyltransferase involved in cell wall biosynthesis